MIGAVTQLWPDRATSVDAVGVGFALVAGLCYGLYTNAAKELLGEGMPGRVRDRQ